MVDSAPIFVVGPSRSGTSLTQAMLNEHSLLWIARETHYFDDLRPRLGKRGKAPLTARARAECEQYFLALAHRPYGQPGDAALSKIDPDELRYEAQRSGDDADAYFEAFCRLRGLQHGKKRWGEKTPRHVFRIDDMLATYPTARIISLARDPRAVNASYRDWTHAAATQLDPERDAIFAADRERARRSYDLVMNSLLWRGAQRAALGALRKYGPKHIYIQRYEDLVANPEPAMRSLTSWLGVDFEPAMLHVPVVRSSYIAEAQRGIWKQPLERWREKLSPGEIRVVETCCGNTMTDLGYPREAVPASPLELARAWGSVPAAFARAAFANRRRLGQPAQYVQRRLRFILRG